MRKILIYLLAIKAFVGCESGNVGVDDVTPPFEGGGEDGGDAEDPMPVRPIKPRPIVPDGTIKRPRLVEISFDLVGQFPGVMAELPCAVVLCNAEGDVVVERQLTTPDEVINVVVEGTEPLYLYINDECVAEYATEN